MKLVAPWASFVHQNLTAEHGKAILLAPSVACVSHEEGQLILGR